MDKINFINGTTKLSKITMDQFQDNIDDAITEVADSLEDKQDTLTAGDNITIENGIISASGGSDNNYSTTETVIGTWFGKPLYKKTFELTPTTSGEQSIVVNDFPTNVDKIWFDKSNTFLLTTISGTARTVQGINNPSSPNYWFDSCIINKGTKSLYFYVGSAIYNGSTIYATIFYTKTTD